MYHLVASGHRLEWRWHGPPPDAAPTLVFLHEGLGCTEMWKDFPAEVAVRTGLGALVYTRAGYGGSDPVPLPRPLDYMQIEGEHTLPEVLEITGVREMILVGHSDGASIAIVYAATHPQRVRGVVLLAPHVFCEVVSVKSIAAAKRAYEEGDLRARLAKYHGDNVDNAFRGWNDAWLHPEFRLWNIEPYLAKIRAPILVIQGENDEYGTLAQVDAIERGARVPVTRVVLPDCGHSPQKDRRQATEDAIVRFVRQDRRSTKPPPRSTKPPSR